MLIGQRRAAVTAKCAPCPCFRTISGRITLYEREMAYGKGKPRHRLGTTGPPTIGAVANGRVNRLARDPIADIFAVAPTFENIGFHYEEPGPLGSPADQPAAKLASGTHGVGTAADGGRLRGARVAGHLGMDDPQSLPSSIDWGAPLDLMLV